MKRPRIGEPRGEPLERHGSGWLSGGEETIGTTGVPDGLGRGEEEERRDAEDAQGSLSWAAHGSAGVVRLRGTGSASGESSVSEEWVRNISMMMRASMGSAISYCSRKCEKASQ
jgi:hypothetical protein